MDELFRKYAVAFDAFNPQAIANLYRLPCAIADGDGVQTFTDKDALVKKFTFNCETMRSLGYQNTEFNVLEKQQLGKDKTAVTIGWRLYNKGSNIDFRTLYICHQIDNSWFIFSANVYEGSFGNGC